MTHRTILEGICHTAVGGKQGPGDESVMREKTNEVKAKAGDGHSGARTGLEGRQRWEAGGPRTVFLPLVGASIH